MRVSGVILFFICLGTISVKAQSPVIVHPNQSSLLESEDPKLEANKKLVSDFVRNVLQSGNSSVAHEYVTEEYIQHHAGVESGLKALEVFIDEHFPAQPIPDQINRLVSIVAERDLVILAFRQEIQDPTDAKKTSTTTTFDMFRIEGGRIAEHWDSPRKTRKG